MSACALASAYDFTDALENGHESGDGVSAAPGADVALAAHVALDLRWATFDLDVSFDPALLDLNGVTYGDPALGISWTSWGSAASPRRPSAWDP